MIIKLCADIILSIFNTVLGALSFIIPSETWAQILSVMSDVYTWFEQGAGVIATFTHFTYICNLFSVVLLFRLFLMGYHVFMWILRKIPFWGVRE